MFSEKWDSIVLTRDWHCKDHVSFAKNHNLPNFAPFVYCSPVVNDERKIESTLWPVHCIEDTEGADIAPSLQAVLRKHPEIVLVNKGYLKDREYYSAFCDIWDDHNTELHEILQQDGIDEVVVVGLALDYCVKNSAISAAKLGYKTTILKKYTRAIDNHKDSLRRLAKEFEYYGVILDES
ncbi:hypothetical protein Kpol_1041p36 [Vanderwaltozyma polyspora DSM 70294]|uniref:nicotinamidase n=1 Tax=Vanderwaltozyma polyspora (strain ATCC 22028 / DSM 70294 / BCRC 21397 / CBS 2163 / NBRC 10782 / NRRL Y-8283 / UCD 57-17) TaxID=436907 RepID=A7TLA3_VANPO|nr:uncharacterized protein Kpol_1041p36 [Vanderwaltozyma polyspora DSM 70294]EDO16978.1 hypothetical protein Kpol_1041p36 [Vanderwaltozyma polyspora DSM 70294]